MKIMILYLVAEGAQEADQQVEGVDWCRALHLQGTSPAI